MSNKKFPEPPDPPEPALPPNPKLKNLKKQKKRRFNTVFVCLWSTFFFLMICAKFSEIENSYLLFRFSSSSSLSNVRSSSAGAFDSLTSDAELVCSLFVTGGVLFGSTVSGDKVCA